MPDLTDFQLKVTRLFFSLPAAVEAAVRHRPSFESDYQIE